MNFQINSPGSGTQLHRRVMADPDLSAMSDVYIRKLPKNLSYTAALEAAEERKTKFGLTLS